MTKFCVFGALTFGLVAVSAMPLAASPLEVGGHLVDIVRTQTDEDALFVDGKVVHTNGLILLDELPIVVGGATVVSGYAGAGGNACGAAPMVVQFGPKLGATVFGPLESCNEFDMRVEADRIVYQSTASPVAAGETWFWQPDVGFVTGPAIPFAQDPTLSWRDLAVLVDRHPADALRLDRNLAAVKAGLGVDWPLFAERLSGIGSGDMVEGGFLGQSCIKYTCDADFAVIYLEQETQAVYLIWRVGEGGAIKTWPENTPNWPKLMREILAKRS